MTEEVLNMIVGTNTTLKVWSMLEEQLLPNTKENEERLRDCFFTQKKASQPLYAYIRKIKSLCDNLAVINKPLSVVNKVFPLACGLALKYREFQTTMLSKTPYPTLNECSIFTELWAIGQFWKRRNKHHRWLSSLLGRKRRKMK